MSVNHPARHYIYFLLSRRIYDIATIYNNLADLGIVVPRTEDDVKHYVDDTLRCLRQMAFPLDFNPTARVPNAETEAFLRRWKIRDAWRGSPFLAKATELLCEPAIRHSLELMLLGPLTASAIAERLKTRYDLDDDTMNTGVVRAYSHYYWDQGAMSPAQWKFYLNQYHAIEAPEYIAALQAPRSTAGAAFVIAVADKDPQLLRPEDRYEAAVAMGFNLLLENALKDHGGTGKTYAAFTALNMMRMADNELDKYRGADSALLAEFNRLETVYDQNRPLAVTQAEFIRKALVVETTAEPVPEE